MKTALLISSYVAASRVGATASAFCLRRLGIETCMLPTTLFGRHPGWGAPGGTKTPPDLLRGIWDGVQAQDIAFDGIMTGYMGHTDHVALAVDIIKSQKQRNPDINVLVDPVMGDHGRLYIDEAVAAAIINDLLPLATIVTPNRWELDYLTQTPPAPTSSIAEIVAKAAQLPCAAIITSVESTSSENEDQIGALYCSPDDTLYYAHKKFESVPNGGGDSLAAMVLAHRLGGLSIDKALSRATASVFAIIEAAQFQDLRELPLVRMQDALLSAAPLPLTPLS